MNAIKIIEDAGICLRNVALAFNGGKESLVVADLCRKSRKNPVKIWFWNLTDEPQQLVDFVERLAINWKISLVKFQDSSMKDVIRTLKEQYDVDAVITGIRRTDPHGQYLDYFSPTDPSWPSIIQVSPLLDYSYQEVWKYIERNGLQYPTLYESHGFTSLGSCQTTFPNYLLWNGIGYNHANTLLEPDGTIERIGRLSGCQLPVTVEGIVVSGFGRGKELGYPTANISLDNQLTFTLQDGVYACTARLRGKDYPAVCSVGQNITFENCERTFETHLIATLEDFYGKILEVTVYFFLRPMLKFEKVDSLITMIEQDLAREKYHRIAK